MSISPYLFIHDNPVVLKGFNSIGGVMVSMLASSAVDRWFEPRSGQTNDVKQQSLTHSKRVEFNLTK